MLDIKKPPKRRGFYVKMKLSHKHKDKNNTNLCFKYYKWVLWLSLSLYFFGSYFITKTKPTSLPNPPKTNIISRALIESNSNPNTKDELNNLKVYIYELPSKYNEDWLVNPRCSSHLFASEVAIHKALLKSGVRTFDPYHADFFFVPVYVSCNFSTVNGFPAIGHARSLLGSAVDLISGQYPFWNRSNGSDHVFVASHDYGACFHAMEERAVEDGIPKFLKNSIILQTFGVKYEHPCQDVENVVIPPYISPESIRTTLQGSPTEDRRDIWAFFRGKMEVHPKNISGRYYSKRVRTAILRKFSNDGRFYLQRQRFAGYQSEIVRSVFCLCPLGWAPWSPRLVESVVLGCVPVIIADGIRLPFSSAVHWSKISLTVAENDVGNLGKILEHVESTNLSTIQHNLNDLDIKRALLFNSEVERGDATWHVLSELAGKLDRSYKRAKGFERVGF